MPNGIAEYWIVDPDARLIERWRPNDERPEVGTDRLVWAAATGRPAFEMDVAAFFAEILGSAS